MPCTNPFPKATLGGQKAQSTKFPLRSKRKELLGRGIGKAAQPIVGEGEGPVEVRHIISWIKDDKPEVPVSRSELSGAHPSAEDPLWH